MLSCDGRTELLVIYKEDYYNIVSVIRERDSMDKIILLRKSPVFKVYFFCNIRLFFFTQLLAQNADMSLLKAMSKVMVLRTYRLDEQIYRMGDRVVDIVFVAIGECAASVTVEAVREVEHVPVPHYRRPTSAVKPLESDMSTSSPPHSPLSPHAFLSHPHSLNIPRPLSPGSHPSSQLLSHHRRPPSPSLSPSLIPPPQSSSRVSALKNHGKTKPTPSKALLHKKLPAMQVPSVVHPSHSTSTHSHNVTVMTQKVHLGRLGPGSILASHLAFVSTLQEDCFHKETVVACTLLQAYVIFKNDLMHRFPEAMRLNLRTLLRDAPPLLLPSLWDLQPLQIGAEEWKTARTWELFREQCQKGKKGGDVSVLSKLRWTIILFVRCCGHMV